MQQFRILRIPFLFKNRLEKCVLVKAVLADFCFEDSKKLLSVEELRKLDSFSSEKRKIQYCLGRATTKKALSYFHNKLVPSEINIVNEKSGCPTIENHNYSTSITHTDEIAASLVFKNEFSFGIDIESLRENKINAIKSIISCQEQILDDLKSLTAVWTLKESLSKALKCGFHVPFEEFGFFRFFQNSYDIFTCSYIKHMEFKGVAQYHDSNFYAITYPTNIKFLFNVKNGFELSCFTH